MPLSRGLIAIERRYRTIHKFHWRGIPALA
jgi:hypothetical protein